MNIMGQSLENKDFSITLSPGTTLASVTDDHRESSNQNVASDGYTYIDENALKAFNFKLSAYHNFDEKWALGTGFFYNKIRLNPRNQDGSYIGTSVYHVSYASLPLILRFRSNEIKDNFRITGGFGPSLDIKLKEEAKGADYAHFMNFANNRYDLDPDRGRNGNNKNMNLFGTFGFSLHFNVLAEYMLGDNFNVFAGVSYQHRLNNLLNGNLKYNDAAQTPITDVLAFRAHTLAFDIGVGYRFD